MNDKQMTVAAALMLSLLLAGCARVTTRVRQADGTYRTSKCLMFRSDLPSRSFSSAGDDSVATEFRDVTYFFPKGEGSFSKDFDKIDFEGRQVRCCVVGRMLTVNDLRFGEFAKGDLIRITSDGKVLVNDVERRPLGDK